MKEGGVPMVEFDGALDHIEMQISTLYVCARCMRPCEFTSGTQLRCGTCGSVYPYSARAGGR